MILYHASSKALPIGDHLRTPTGRADGSITDGGAVYLTETPGQCARYGTVYTIECTNPVPYKQALARIGRSKKARYTRGVYVAAPADTIIKGVYTP